MEWIELGEPLTLKTFSTVMYGPGGFERKTSYFLEFFGILLIMFELHA
jgi:hypothetical protein